LKEEESCQKHFVFIKTNGSSALRAKSEAYKKNSVFLKRRLYQKTKVFERRGLSKERVAL
jgi:hypothetical protein